MATRIHSHPRHAAPSRHTNRITTTITHAVGWVLADHDDRIPSLIQNVVLFAAFTALFVCVGLQR